MNIVITVAMLVAIVTTGSVTIPVSSPKIQTTLHSIPLPLQVYDVTVLTPTRAFVWNFTANLMGKNPGSDQFSFVLDVSGGSPLAALFSDQNLTQWLSMPLTFIDPVLGFRVTHVTQQLAYEVVVPTSAALSSVNGATMAFLPPASGTYHIAFLNLYAFMNLIPGQGSPMHIEIHGVETWTTTTIS